MKKLLLLIAMFALFFSEVQATHYMGGEITWECLPNGRYRFILKAYRECYITAGSPAAQFAATQTLQTTVPGFANITMNLLAGWPQDISPKCNTNPLFPKIVCTGMSTGTANMGAVQEHIFTSDVSYPSGVPLTGVPPVTGWLFFWQDCCRNPSTNIINANSLYWRLRALMYPYNNQNVNPCFDNSPKFVEIPRTVICTGYPFKYNHLAVDKELDSLRYVWDQPQVSGGAPITAYAAGYSYLSPLPGPIFNPNNVAAQVNGLTGEITFTSFTNGAFVTVTKVTAFKCGIKVAEIFRDMQVVLLACGSNSPPNVTPPFINPATGQYTLFNKTVYAGEFVSFPISATDFQFLPNGTPQMMELQSQGLQYGDIIPGSPGPPVIQPTMSTTTGCLNKPCATLTPAPNPPTQPLKGQFGLVTNFAWETRCEHVKGKGGCNTSSNIYTFVFKVFDDFCPAPAINIATVTITVLTKPSLPPPIIHCLSVDSTNGNVNLSWRPVKDTMNTFNSYHIYRSTNPAGPFIVIDSIFNINTFSYNDVTINANTQKVYYFMQTRCGCFGDQYSNSSDTSATIFLDVTNPGSAFGIAQLDWNHIHNPNYPSSTGIYKIFREYPANTGNWSQIGLTSDTLFVDSVSCCGKNIKYRVEIDDTLMFNSVGAPIMCTSVSSIDGDYFDDSTAPLVPIIDTVSVDMSTSFTHISWDVNASGDCDRYIIYRNIGTGFSPIDTVYGRLNTTYIDNVNSACTQSQAYQVAALDSCNNKSPNSLTHTSIYATTDPQMCDDKIIINWNHYINLNGGGLLEYEILFTENGGPLVSAGTVLATDSIFEHMGLTNNSTYCYYIRAKSLDGTKTSTSCVACQIASKPRQPNFLYLRTATVNDNNLHVNIRAHLDIDAFAKEYRLFRSTDLAGPYIKLQSFPQTANPLLEYTDVSAAVRQISYYYYLSVIDSCGDEWMFSDTAKTIHLSVKAMDDMTNVISWNDYEGWDPLVSGTPTTYDIYRRVDGVMNPIGPLATISAGIGSYDDDVSLDPLPASSGNFEYYVQAIEGPGNIFNIDEISQSNQVVALQKPKMYVPNAFHPQGVNKTFIPVGVFVDPNGYSFKIFNRWGELLFETKDVFEGWNGTYKNNIAPTGVYVYQVKFRNSAGESFEKRGTVTLIK